MSLRTRRTAALAAGLALAIALAPTAPARAAGIPETAALVLTRAWSWMETLGFPKPAAASRRPVARWAKEGSMIDPDGRTRPAPPASAVTVQSGGNGSDNGQN